MKTAKLGAIFLISIMALAGVGAGYAAWTDTITIDGSVNTGSVGWYFSGVSGTWAWKDVVTEECIVRTTSTKPNDNCILIAYSEAVIDPNDDHSVTLTFDSLFPCINFIADFTVTYDGTVPGKINWITVTDGWMADANAAHELLMDYCVKLDVKLMDAAGAIIEEHIDIPFNPAIFLGWQLHNGYTIYVVMRIHLDQNPALMDLTGSFDMDVEVVQWNLYPYQHPT